MKLVISRAVIRIDEEIRSRLELQPFRGQSAPPLPWLAASQLSGRWRRWQW